MRTNLKLFRVKQRLTQGEVAERIGCSLNQYSMIERGARNGTVVFWQKFQQAFNIEDSELWELTKVEE